MKLSSKVFNHYIEYLGEVLIRLSISPFFLFPKIYYFYERTVMQ